VEIPGFSLELCGGCHVRNTGEIGPFVLRSERGVASGVRRIEALTGERALEWLHRRDVELSEAESALGAEVGRSLDEIERLRVEIRERAAELEKLRLQMVSGAAAASEEIEVEGVKLLVREVPPAPGGELRKMADVLRDRLGSGVVVLGSRGDGKVALVATATEDVRARVPAGRLVREIAARVGGSGGGRDDFAQAGGREPDKLPEALGSVPEVVAKMLSGTGS